MGSRRGHLPPWDEYLVVWGRGRCLGFAVADARHAGAGAGAGAADRYVGDIPGYECHGGDEARKDDGLAAGASGLSVRGVCIPPVV